MGFYLNFNLRSLNNKDKYYSYLFKFTKKFIAFLKRKKLIISDKFRINVFNPKTQKYYGGRIFRWKIFNTQFDKYFNLYENRNACMQIISTMKMNHPDNGLEIPVNFEIFLNKRTNGLVNELGHWSFEISGESEDFPEANSEWDFNDFFSNIPYNTKNIKLFKELRNFFEQENLKYKRIKRINAGDGSLPWEKIHNAIYVYRDSLENLQQDLFANFEIIRNEIKDKSYIIDNERRRELSRIWRENLFSKVKKPILRETITYLNRTNHFIEEYLFSENVAHRGSFRLFDEKNIQPLYSIIEKFYGYITETIDEVTTWPEILNGFIEKWNQKYSSIKDKKIY